MEYADIRKWKTIPLFWFQIRYMNLIVVVVVVDIFSSNIVSNYGVTAIPLLVSGYVLFRGPFTCMRKQKKVAALRC